MRRDGEYIYFTDGERDVLGLADLVNPVHVNDIDVLRLDAETRKIEYQLGDIQMADDDEALSTERGYIVSAGNLLARRQGAIRELMRLWMSADGSS